jgi:phosphoribosylamine--glycine ligase
MQKKYNVIILGSGGRESALAWSIARSPLLGRLVCVPGNPGTERIAKNISADINDFKGIARIALENQADLIVTGPEEPLVRGIRDYFGQDALLSEILFIGPDSRGAELEGSKEKAKEFMQKYSIPTARYRSFKTGEENAADLCLEDFNPPYVIKADGLAAGKGVIILDDLQEAKSEMRSMLGGKFGAASGKVVIEEYLDGIELSVFVLTDGENYMILPEAKDYKRVGEMDTGPNTGGMGAVSPVPFAGKEFMQKVEERIIVPTIEGLKHENILYRGFIFFGLMNCKGNPYVIEYNVRMGDPETEAVLPRIESDLLKHLVAAAQGRLSEERISISSQCAMTLVAVSGGYPGDYSKGFVIDGLDKVNDALVFHAGTKRSSSGIVTGGGRVLAVTVLAENIIQAREKLYGSVSGISFENIYFRQDLGKDLLDYTKG